MMERIKYLKIMFVLAAMGFLFSGYLTFSKILLKTCPLNEPCSVFLGVPTCVFGFAMFTLMLAFSAAGVWCKRAHPVCMTKANLAVSFAGIIFSGYFAIKEIFFTECYGEACRFSLGLPSCAYGLLFFIAVFALSIVSLSKKAAPIKTVAAIKPNRKAKGKK